MFTWSQVLINKNNILSQLDISDYLYLFYYPNNQTQ